MQIYGGFLFARNLTDVLVENCKFRQKNSFRHSLRIEEGWGVVWELSDKYYCD
jgi:hypothetical protein